MGECRLEFSKARRDSNHPRSDFGVADCWRRHLEAKPVINVTLDIDTKNDGFLAPSRERIFGRCDFFSPCCYSRLGSERRRFAGRQTRFTKFFDDFRTA